MNEGFFLIAGSFCSPGAFFFIDTFFLFSVFSGLFLAIAQYRCCNSGCSR